MKPVILLSCMNQTDESIISRSNIKCDVIVVNQCDKDEIKRFTFHDSCNIPHNAIFINTTERGLSKSRNLAISYASDDSICILSDDDEIFADDLVEKILSSYYKNPEVNLITFALIRSDMDAPKKYPANQKQMDFRQICRTSSQQISFKKIFITLNDIRFDEQMGSGTGNGCGEEIKFMLDCRRKKAKLLYNPHVIATIIPGESKWFKGYDEKFLRNFGWSSRRAMGSITGFAYIIYWALSHRALYKEKGIGLSKACLTLIAGYFSKR